MKKLWFVFAAIVLGFAGCAGNPEKDIARDIPRMPQAEPPAFLNPDVAGLFGKADFSARVEIQKGIPGTHPPMLGDLFGHDGSLFFISDGQRSKRGVAGGLSVLWDGPTQTAYLLNEPLQAYAPIRNNNTNGPAEVVAAGEEELGAEHCRKSILTRRVGADVVPVLVVWRGVAQQDFPLRIQMTNTPGAVTLNLTRVRFQAPPADVFALPNGFKKYDSTDAMMAELVRRRTDLLSGRASRKRDRYGNTALEEEEPGETGMPPRRTGY
jgi:hypothetical protein